MKTEKPRKDFQYRQLLEIHQANSDRGGGTWLGVAVWIVDGKETRPVLEKREFYSTDNPDIMKQGKAKGLNTFDIEKVIARLPDVAKAIGMPWSVVQQLTEQWNLFGENGSAVKPEQEPEPVEVDPWKQ